ncbi:SRPBCC domain-containing protein [Agromyces sp. NPDC057679]|uniref:SRPBCC domain-containing protein n=1 Tax=Agromyces sp. NPDC057679 TaxID=3346207 RepID=UPI0036715DC4
MAEDFDAISTTTVEASSDRVWAVITDPVAAREFMFGTELVTDWAVGGPIRWRGEWKGEPYEDHGTVLEVIPGERLVHTHFSPLSGEPDLPEHHHTLTWTLDEQGGSTVLTLRQDNNPSAEAMAHSKRMWDSLVAKVKEIAERS